MAESDRSQPDYSPIHRVVADYVKSGGKRVHFWDHNHGSPIPREVFGDPKLLDAVRAAGGKPAYILEDASKNANKLLDEYRTTTPEVRNDIVQAIKEGAASYSPQDPERRANSDINILENARTQNIPLYSPDIRGNMNVKFTSSEEAMFQKVAKPTIFSTLNDCLPVTGQTLFDNSIMNQKELDIIKSAGKKFNQLTYANGTLKTGELDKKIADNILKHAGRKDAPANEIQLVMYGGAHYEKPKDINENAPGLSIAVIPDAKAIEFNKNSFSGKTLAGISLPDYAWYGQTNTLVKLDNDAAKAQFLGVDDATYQKLKSDPKAVIPKQELSPEVKAACKAEAETLIQANIKDFREAESTDVKPPASHTPAKNPKQPAHTRP
jgi:hypothetical protein